MPYSDEMEAFGMAIDALEQQEEAIKLFQEQRARHLSMGWDLAGTKAIGIVKGGGTDD